MTSKENQYDTSLRVLDSNMPIQKPKTTTKSCSPAEPSCQAGNENVDPRTTMGEVERGAQKHPLEVSGQSGADEEENAPKCSKISGEQSASSTAAEASVPRATMAGGEMPGSRSQEAQMSQAVEQSPVTRVPTSRHVIRYRGGAGGDTPPREGAGSGARGKRAATSSGGGPERGEKRQRVSPRAPAQQVPQVPRVPLQEMQLVANEAHRQHKLDKALAKLKKINIKKRALEEKVTAMSTWQYISLGGLVVDSNEMHTSHGLTVSGSYGSTVHEAQHFDQEVAVKKVPKKSKCSDIRAFLNNRISQHKHLLSSSLMTEDKDFYYIVTDRCRCSLDEFIHSAKTRLEIGLPESTIAKEIALGLAHLHSEDMMHRGLHPWNVLIKDENGILKTVLSDFGQSRAEKIVGEGHRSSDEIVQNGYMSPSTLGFRQIYTKMDDMFSYGVVAHELASRMHPFDDDEKTTREQRYENMRMYKVTIFGTKPGEDPSEERTAGHNGTVKENDDHLLLAFVIRWLLEEDETKRPTARQLEMGPFLMDEARRFKFLANAFEYFGDKLGKGAAVRYFNDKIGSSVITEYRNSRNEITRNWYTRLTKAHREFLEDDKNKWSYEEESVGHLLRALRNSEGHMPSVTALQKEEFDKTHPRRRQQEWEHFYEKELYRVFETLAPGLLLRVYDIVLNEPGCEEGLTRYSK